MSVLKSIEGNIVMLKEGFAEISSDRKFLLKDLADYITDQIKGRKIVNLTFICTHNSHRSHMSQIWAQTTAEYFSIENVYCYSGGTEATAFNPRAVKAMQKLGFEIKKMSLIIRYSL